MKKRIKKKVAVLFSGGKDSCLALHKALDAGYKVVYLLSVMPKNFDSFMFHKSYLNLLRKQARELGIRLRVRESKGKKEEELNDLRELIKEVKDKIEGVVVGGIASSYQGKRIKKICEELGLEFIAPLWNYTPQQIWEELLNNNFEVVITKIACDGLSKDWLGKIIDKENLEDLKKLAKKYKFRIDFEGGEAESAVLFMPEFNKRIRIDFEIESEGDFRHWMKNVKIK